MTHSVSVLITGSEITDGRVHDTNAHFIATQCFERGIPFRHFLACDDALESIKSSLAFLLQRSSVVIVSGGLGPTSDDCTREAIAEHLGLPLELAPSVLTHLRDLYQRRQRRMDESNQKQAHFPKGAKVLPNPVGTAAGFCLELPLAGSTSTILVGPGVPYELRRMFEEQMLPIITQRFEDRAGLEKRYLRLFGMPESAVGERIVALSLPTEIEVSYRAHFPEIQLLFKSSNRASLEQWMPKVESALGVENIFSTDPQRTHEAAIHQLLIERGATVATAESCTAGMVGALLTSLPGSSAFFVGGVIAYHNVVKELELAVPETVLRTHGAVSYETARAMAEAAQKKFGSTFALSITGISGPDGGSAEKPVGTFYVGIASAARSASYHFFYPGERVRTRIFEAHTALEVLRRTLLDIPIKEHRAA